MNKVRIATLAALALLIPTIAAAAPAHSLEIVESTQTLISDVAFYLKYLLPGIAVAYTGFGAIMRAIAGDDDMKKSKADKTMANARVGLVMGLVAAPLMAWLQQYYGGAA